MAFSKAHDIDIHHAAEQLADLLRELAVEVAGHHKPRRVSFGRGRLGSSLRRHSPAGFVVDPVNLQLLLPDGRLWSYTRSDSQRFPAGRYYDPRTDYTEFAGGRSFPGGTEFTFLGAVIGKYTFGFANGQDSLSPHGLCAIVSEGRAVRYVGIEEAMADIAHTIHAPRPGQN